MQLGGRASATLACVDNMRDEMEVQFQSGGAELLGEKPTRLRMPPTLLTFACSEAAKASYHMAYAKASEEHHEKFTESLLIPRAKTPHQQPLPAPGTRAAEKALVEHLFQTGESSPHTQKAAMNEEASCLQAGCGVYDQLQTEFDPT